MHLTRAELECLTVHNAGHVAQRRLARGLKLNLPEAVALLTSQGLEFIRDGQEDINKLEADIRRLLGFRQVLPGVPELVQDLVFEAPFSDGPRLVNISDPICAPDGDLDLALRGSCLPAPMYEVFGDIVDDRSVVPGAITVNEHHQSPIELNADAPSTSFMYITNTGDSEISIGSHFHLTEANRLLQFDRTAALGKRLNIPAGEVVSFQSGETKEVALVEIGGQRIVRGGNFICDGPLDDNSQRKIMKNLKKRGYLNRLDAGNGEGADDRYGGAHIGREQYIQVYGPTTGDKVQLADTCLVIEVERDLTTYGDECMVGVGKVAREGMGQMANVRNDVAVDMVIGGAIVIDPIMGIFKADIGIRDGLIQSIGKAGNPHTMSGVTIPLGVGTDVIPAQNLIVTPGTFVPGLNASSKGQVLDMVLLNGMTSAFLSGASGSVTGTTAGPNALKQALQSLDDLPVNTGIMAKANTSKSEGFPKEVEDVLASGAACLTLSEMWGCTSAALDTALRLADYHDVPLVASLDGMRECYSPGELLTISKQRLLLVPYGKELTSEILKHPSVILTSQPRFVRVDVPTDALERLSEEVLQDVGAISFITSSNTYAQQEACHAHYVRSVWQMAHRMKALRGPLPEETTDSDNFRVMRYLAKYTINPAIAFGCEHLVGSLQVDRLADMSIWEPGYFGVRPKYVLKGGQLVAMEMMTGEIPSLSIGSQPTKLSGSMGCAGKSPAANSLFFTCKAGAELAFTNAYAIQKQQAVVKKCRTLNRSAMILNCTSSKLTVDEAMGKIYVDAPGRRETFSVHDMARVCSDINPLSQRYTMI